MEGGEEYTCCAIATAKGGLSKHNKQNIINKIAGNWFKIPKA